VGGGPSRSHKRFMMMIHVDLLVNAGVDSIQVHDWIV
jgi:hypothetical protein